MEAQELILLVLLAAIFASVVALGCTARPADALSLWRSPGLLLRSLAALYLVAPILALGVVELLPLPRGVKIGLVLLSISCALPPNWKQMLVLGGRPSYVFGLLFTTTLLAMVTIPLSLAALTALPLAADASVPWPKVAALVAIVFFVPLTAGMAIQRLAPQAAKRINVSVSQAAGWCSLASLLGLLAINFSAVREFGPLSFVAIAFLILCNLALGHWLAGPERGDRATLAIANATRFPGLAGLIAASSFPDKNALAVIVAYMIVTIPLLHAHAWWWKKTAARDAGATAAQTPAPTKRAAP